VKAAATTKPTKGSTSRRKKDTGPAKLFVLDTNVLLHDPMSLFRFEEHDVYLPMITLEELDGHKKGMTEVARNARQVSRDLDSLAADMSNRQQMDPASGIPLNKTGHAGAGGKLYFQTTGITIELPMGLPQGKADNQILGVVQALRKEQPEREVVLVSKDINMRIKARACLPRTTSTTRRWTTATCSTPACSRCPLTSGSATPRAWRAGSKVAPPATASAARWCPC
jgi:PhoH-like ATPase